MDDDIIFRYKNGRIIPIKVNKEKTTNEYMNEKIRNPIIITKGDGTEEEYNDYDENEFLFKNENNNILYENCVKTQEQKIAISDYTTDLGYGGSELINRYFNEIKEVNPNVANIIKNKANAIESAINQPLQNNIYFYKGVETYGEEIEIGREFIYKGFTSGSIFRKDARDHGKVIKTKAHIGDKALYIGDKTSHENNEHEILFERNYKIIITGKSKEYEDEYEGELIKIN